MYRNGINQKTAQPFEQAMIRLGGNKQNTIVFEDALYAIRSAKEGGFYVIAIAEDTRPNDTAEIQTLADKYIYSYEDLL